MEKLTRGEIIDFLNVQKSINSKISDLSGSNLSHEDLSKLDLNNVNLSNCNR